MRSDDVHYVIEPPRQVKVAIPGYNPLGILTTIHAAFEKKRQKKLEKKRRSQEAEVRNRKRMMDSAQNELQALNAALLQHSTVPSHSSTEVDFQDTEPAFYEDLHGETNDGLAPPWLQTTEGNE